MMTCSFAAMAQQRVLGEVKKKISSLTLTADVYKGAITTLAPALTHDDTKNLAETWYLQGKLQYGFYDKCIDTKSIGKKVDVKAMGHALINGYEAYTKALPLDTVFETDKKGNFKLDKSGNKKYKTKYSAEIIKNLTSHFNDYNTMAGEMYNVKDWDGAFSSWNIYCDMASSGAYKSVPDSLMGKARYFQALALWQKGEVKKAVDYFGLARRSGYVKKECFDYALACMSINNDLAGINVLAREAYEVFGSSDPKYLRIIINDNIKNKEFDQANKLLDEIIAVNDSDAEIFNLKGIVVEQMEGMEKAFPFYQKSIELNPNNAQGQFNVGRYYYNKVVLFLEKNPKLSGRKLTDKVNPLYREALPYFEKAYELDNTNVDVKNALSNIYYKLGEGKKLQQIENKR